MTKVHLTSEQFRDSIIAQDDDNAYSEDGYVACLINGVSYLAKYGHCSCYGTFEALCARASRGWPEEGDASFTWSGTPDELVAMAHRTADPAMPDRQANEEDCDYDHLCNVYRQVIAWDQRGRKTEEAA